MLLSITVLKTNLSSFFLPNNILHTIPSITELTVSLKFTSLRAFAAAFISSTISPISSLLIPAKPLTFVALSNSTVQNFLTLRQYGPYSEKVMPLLS
ncbi:hypothetical protein HanIR_Chr08g0365441 [Helianthus annuus]|nr:hypothetical protein HanIR_Chr08g0365441 [Helianthus annuus]